MLAGSVCFKIGNLFLFLYLRMILKTTFLKSVYEVGSCATLRNTLSEGKVWSVSLSQLLRQFITYVSI